MLAIAGALTEGPQYECCKQGSLPAFSSALPRPAYRLQHSCMQHRFHMQFANMLCIWPYGLDNLEMHVDQH